MAVYYTGGGGGLLGTLGKALSMGAAFIPGLQPFAPYIAGATALANGDVGGAIGNVAGGLAGNVTRTPSVSEGSVNGDALNTALMSGAKNAIAGGPSPGSPLFQAYINANKNSGGIPDWRSDPVTGQPNPWRSSWNSWRG